jgi:hypothetical protein
VQNTVRFLLMLDADGDASNGIMISDSVRTRAASWAQVDFTTTDLPAALATIIADAISADGGTHVLPDATAARTHLEATVRCTRAGAFRGTYAGDDRGVFGILVLASNNNLLGLVYSTVEDEFFSAIGTAGISLDQEAAFVVGNTSSGGSFSGRFTSANSVTGTWSNAPDAGTFTGNRIGGTADAEYRFTGAYAGNDAGLFSFDVDTADRITGVAYSVLDDEQLTLTGTVSGTTVSGTVTGGSTFTGTLNKATGSLSGTWMDTAGGSGNFGGDGCRLK